MIEAFKTFSARRWVAFTLLCQWSHFGVIRL